jgi:integration host factor subunit beta
MFSFTEINPTVLRRGLAKSPVKSKSEFLGALNNPDGLLWHESHSVYAGFKVIRSELSLRLAGRNPHLFQRDVEKVMNALLDQIIAALARGDRIELRGFGTFTPKVREGRVGRNPRTGAKVDVPEKNIPYFR